MPFLTLEEVLAAHARVKSIPLANAPDHVHRMDLLESALARPRNAAAYESADLATQAATLLWGIVRNHPFRDGNKRTALIATVAFLDVNGYTVQMTDDEKFDLVVGVANTRLSVEDVARTIRSTIREAPTASARAPDPGPEPRRLGSARR